MPYFKFQFLIIIFVISFLLTTKSFASFIETTIGTAIVNDATASYYNPGALVLLKNSQIIPLGSIAGFQTRFTGRSTSVATHFTQAGSSESFSSYYSPSLFIAKPLNNNFYAGLAVVSNFANRNPEENSILRYVQSSNSIQDYDIVPSIGLKVTPYFSLGLGVNFSHTNFNLHPITGFPGSNIPDSQSNNQSKGSGVGYNIGFLLQPRTTTLIGFDYRSVTTYEENGTSALTGPSSITSNNYHFKLRTPARSILSISQSLTPTMGLIATIQRIQWKIVRNINVYGLATTSGMTPIIINASIPYYLRNTWVLTLGGNYRFKPNWIIRVAGTYNQSPNNGFYQLSTGDSYVLGASVGHEINKIVTIDGSYAHAFIQNKNINITGARFLINGVNQAARDVVSVKLTFNV